jgi:hypothetical protein
VPQRRADRRRRVREHIHTCLVELCGTKSGARQEGWTTPAARLERGRGGPSSPERTAGCGDRAGSSARHGAAGRRRRSSHPRRLLPCARPAHPLARARHAAPVRAGSPAEHLRSFAPISSLGSRLDPIHTVAPIRCVCLYSPLFASPLPQLRARKPAPPRRPVGASGQGASDRRGGCFANRSAPTTLGAAPSSRARIAHAPGLACPVPRTPGRGAALRAATPTQTCICPLRENPGLTAARTTAPAGVAVQIRGTLRPLRRHGGSGCLGPNTGAAPRVIHGGGQCFWNSCPPMPVNSGRLRTTAYEHRTNTSAAGRAGTWLSSRGVAPRASLCLGDVDTGARLLGRGPVALEAHAECA